MSLRHLAPVRPSASVIVGASPALAQLVARATHIAASEAKVLITGESGVGKDLVARLVHAHSPRAAAPYVAVNCAGLAETLLESELFGHARGSFTGAYRDKPGLLLQADGGTLFLDEVGEMSLRMQAVLLRFLETGEVQAVGADARNVRVDVRLVAATNRNLHERVAAGTFREDLLYRLTVVQLHVPPLRERRDDVRPIVAHVLNRLRRRLTFTDAALAALEGYGWPGNVRELQNVVEQVAWSVEGDRADVADLPERVRPGATAAIVPQKERRRQVADQLYDELVAQRIGFWEDVHRLFLDRDITRSDLRGLVARGLSETRGSYRLLLPLFHLPPGDYKKLLNFLAAHDCKVAVQPFRNSHAAHPPFANLNDRGL